MLATELAALFARDLRRLQQQLDAFPDDATVWATAPGVTNSAATLALHLEGNLREYIGRQLGRVEYRRNRPAEFSARDTSRAELLTRIAGLGRQIPPIIAALPANALDQPYPEAVLGVPMSSRQFLVHLLGHFNYHLGQIDYLRRVMTGNGAIEMAGL